jgi:HSP20 family molecular chaperone IbpA
MLREEYSQLKIGVFGRISETTRWFLDSTPQAREITEEPDKFVVVFDVPDVSKEDIHVSYRGGEISLWLARDSGSRKAKISRGEPLEGKASLPANANVDPDAATAIVQGNGSVVVELPKRTKRQ